MNANELAEKCSVKVAAAISEGDKQKTAAHDNEAARLDDAVYCKTAMSEYVLPFYRIAIPAWARSNYLLPRKLKVRISQAC
jgi:hypothetical protein